MQIIEINNPFSYQETPYPLARAGLPDFVWVSSFYFINLLILLIHIFWSIFHLSHIPSHRGCFLTLEVIIAETFGFLLRQNFCSVIKVVTLFLKYMDLINCISIPVTISLLNCPCIIHTHAESQEKKKKSFLFFSNLNSLPQGALQKYLWINTFTLMVGVM